MAEKDKEIVGYHIRTMIKPELYKDLVNQLTTNRPKASMVGWLGFLLGRAEPIYKEMDDSEKKEHLN